MTCSCVPSGEHEGSIAVWLNMKPLSAVFGVRSHVESSRGSYWWTGSSVAR